MKIEKLNLSSNSNYAETINSESVLNISGSSLVTNKINDIIEQINSHDVNLIRLRRDLNMEEKEKQPETFACPLECPFCGKSPDIFDEKQKYMIRCNTLGCLLVFTSSNNTKEEAIKQWNKRA